LPISQQINNHEELYSRWKYDLVQPIPIVNAYSPYFGLLLVRSLDRPQEDFILLKENKQIEYILVQNSDHAFWPYVDDYIAIAM
jgi:hypothetical protein